ncbi:hypothetical protein [Flavobacterium pallidum]|uniref:Uncharacterized protein n=1 Tax=Flavobacterium pallidum TaxID=2172098 RepID=A0A2S1SF34_9FLAO|nr:hypothetical protein [Flavobacterium pallidum]AWI24989.1 hypothetical protein HYN49_03265 [Flavobacterium pallidum]
MNIIALFEKLQLDKTSVASLSAEAVNHIEERIVRETMMGAVIDSGTAGDLLDALRNYPSEFAFIVGQRTFYNFLADTNHSRNVFKFQVLEVAPERIRDFFERFLSEALLRIAERDLAENNFFNLMGVCSRKAYIPEKVWHLIHETLLRKLEAATAGMQHGTVSGSFENILTNREFYGLLNCFHDAETDAKIKILINDVAKAHHAAKDKALTRGIMMAMSEYIPMDVQIADVIKRNKEVMTKVSVDTQRSSGASFPWWRLLLIAIAVIRLLIWIIKPSPPDTVTVDEAPQSYHFQQKDYKTAEVDPTYFFNYLTNYNKAEVQIDFKPIEIDNEGIPFHGMYDGMIPSSGKSPAELSNNTDYDLILLVESTDGGHSSIYVKAGKKAAVNVGDRNFRFYFGNKLGSFGEMNSTYQRRNAENTYKVQEYRFSVLPQNCRFMLDHLFHFEKDVKLKQIGKQITIESDGLQCVTGIRKVSDGKFVFEK